MNNMTWLYIIYYISFQKLEKSMYVSEEKIKKKVILTIFFVSVRVRTF